MLNKIASIIACFILLSADGVGGLISRTVSAASSDVLVILNGQALNTAPYLPYTSGATVMVPLREVAKALKYKATYEQSTGLIQLIGVKEKIEFKVGDDYLTFNDTGRIQYKDDAVIKGGRVFVPLSFFTTLGLVTAYDKDTNLAEIYSPEVTANAIAGLLAAGQFQELEDRFFSDELKRLIPVTSLQENWGGLSVQAGNYYGVKSTVSSQKEDQFSIQCVLGFAETEASLEILLNKSGKIIDLKEKLLPK